MNIVVISGSPRKNSVTNRVALYLEKALKAKTSSNVGLIDVRDWNLPLLQTVFTSIDKTPDEFKPLAELMFAADAFVLVTPEYNGSYSPALQNLLDHFPKQMHKAFGVVTASVGVMGGMRASQQLLLLICALFGVPCPNMLIIGNVDKRFSETGELIDESFTNSVNTFIHEFLWLAEAVSERNELHK
jgi:NAD(P)H-dependent FMN reductase